jgi:dTDP-3-amino-2,3,6-trideoxy-4-keto-D-glucose/dTDP-3-amino-3,4,6-trideoxy-alpha-D-glucose/dTDP-2,6-dideoxy-D-kanosamine transaminase
MPPAFWSNQREYQELREQILAAIDRVFGSGQLILGPEGEAFERGMAAWVGCRSTGRFIGRRASRRSSR